MNRYHRLALVVPTLILAACDRDGALAFDDLEAEVLAASCAYQELCEAFPDRASCLASPQSQDGFYPTMRADIAAGRVLYNAQAARACVDVFKTLGSCTLTELVSLIERFDKPCGVVFNGTLPPGNTCFFSEECANHGTCQNTACGVACCQGTCVARSELIPAGGTCPGPTGTETCVDGTTCQLDPRTLGTTICTPLLPPGAACTTSNACRDPYDCVGLNGATPGVCTAPAARGQTCGIPGAPLNCNDLRDTCDTNTDTCVANTPVGGSCSTTSGLCVGYAACDGSTCVARGAAGAGCDTATSLTCLGGLECNPTTLSCALPPSSGSCW